MDGRSPRVLHVSQPVDAGVAEVVAQLALDQRDRGWDVRVACPPGPLAERLARGGVPVEPWAASRGPGRSTPAEARALARVVGRVGPDLVHLHSAKAGLAGRLAVRGRIPTLFQPHAWSFDAVTGPVAAAARAWERGASRWTDRLIAVSDAELAAGRAAGVTTPAMVVPNGVDTDRFAPHPGPVADGVPTVLCLGRVTRQKGQDLLLKAWPWVRTAVPAARLVLVGDGPQRAAWSAGTDGSVRWESATSDPRRWYLDADVVVLPSRWEGMPLVALEAMACGRPVVGFDVTGVAEAIGDGGTVVPAGDVRALADAVVARLRPDGPADAEAQRARIRAVTYFDRRRSAERVADVITTVLSSSESHRW